MGVEIPRVSFAVLENNRFREWNCSVNRRLPCLSISRPGRDQKEKEEDTRFYKATPSVGTTKSYATLVRDSSEVEVQEKPYKPTHSPKVKRRIFGEESEQPKAEKGERRSSRIKTKVVSQDKVDALGLRPPQVLQVTKPGHEPLDLYNYHAPQGGGSMPGFSGRHALGVTRSLAASLPIIPLRTRRSLEIRMPTAPSSVSFTPDAI